MILQQDAQKSPTPWQRAFAKFALSQRALGKAIGRDGAKINRKLHDPYGLISGEDQRRLLELAKEMHVDLTTNDITPDV